MPITRHYRGDGTHKCEKKGCSNYVPYDDEPFCFDHSPDSGSSVPGYSYRKNNLKAVT